MGLDYSYLTYFRREHMWDALDRLAEFADLAGAPTRVNLEDIIIRLPFTAWAGTDLHIRWDDPRPEWDFMTVLCFPPDSELEDFYSDEESGPRTVAGRIAVGYIYLTVYNDLTVRESGERDPDLVLFQFAAATSGMSILFSESRSIRATFNSLLRDHGGVCGLLDREMDGVLTWWKGEEMDTIVPNPWAPLRELAADLRLNGS